MKKITTVVTVAMLWLGNDISAQCLGLNMPTGNDYIAYTNPFNAYANELTVEAWVYLDSSASCAPWMGQATPGLDQQIGNVWLWHGTGLNVFTFYVNDAGDWRSIGCPAVTNGWHHIATVADAAGTRIYVDGSLTATGSGIVTGIVNNPSSEIRIGHDPRYPTSSSYQGDYKISEFRLWSIARTQTEIQTDMSACLAATSAGLRIYTAFEDGSGSSAASVTGPTAMMVNMQQSDWVTGSPTECCALPLFASQSQTNATCNDTCNGSATVNAGGGTSPYTYSWAPSGGTGATASSLCAGTYTVTITDNTSTFITETFIITEPAAVSGSTVVSNVSCNTGSNGSIDLTPTGGTGAYTFDWGGGVISEDRTGLSAGSYTVNITDANSCPGTVTVTVTQPAAVSGSTVVTNVSCNSGSNGAIDLTPTGGTGAFTFDWGGGIVTEDRSGLSAGIFTVVITDANSCTGTVTATVTEPAILSASSSATSIACNGGTSTVTVSATGGTLPYTGEGLFTEVAGSYTYTVTDANGCSTTTSVAITEPAVLLASVSASAILCNSDSSSVTVSGSGGTLPYTGDGSFTEAAGTYTYTITDANGCMATDSITITEPAILSASINASTILCNGDSSTVTVSGSGGTLPYTGEGIFNEVAGSYTYTITDANGCSTTATVTITEPTPLAIVPSSTIIPCNGDSSTVTILASGGSSPYSGVGTFTEAAGIYTYIVTDANGCLDSVTVTITEPAILIATASASPILCNGGSSTVTVSASGGTSPYTGEGLFNEVAGTYSYIVTDANGCSDSITVTISEPPPLVAIVSILSDPTACGNTDGFIDITVSGGTTFYTFLWSDNSTNEDLSGVGAGFYSVTITDSNGCTASLTGTLTDPNAPAVTWALGTDTICLNDAAVTLTGGTPPGGTFSGNGVSGNMFNPMIAGAGLHYITYAYTDANNCTGSSTDSLFVDPCVGTGADYSASWNVYPNPTSSVITFTGKTQAGTISILVFAADGRLVLTENRTIVNGTQIITIDLTNEATGIYFVRLIGNDAVSTVKVIRN